MRQTTTTDTCPAFMKRATEKRIWMAPFAFRVFMQ
jgi:hypothetical protein